jgi:mono/diheme cytochrome c family protein
MLSKFLMVGFACGCTLMTVCTLAGEKEKVEYDPAKLPPAAAKTGVTYAADIQPIFSKSCYPCHGPQTPKPKGGLRLDSLQLVLKGGKEGVVVVGGDIAKSTLLGDIAHLGDPDDYMPPPKNKGHIAPLSKEQVGLIRAWVEQGAK